MHSEDGQSGRDQDFVSAGLAFPEPYAGLVRMGGASGTREHHHRELLCRAIQERLGRVRLCGRKPGRFGISDARFVETLRASTIPSVVKEAASANLSTLATTTCFRTADGEFHGFEGSDDTRGCCYGNCTHVWNYEMATRFCFRRSRDRCGVLRLGTRWMMRARCTSGRCCRRKARSGFAAADGQMGQIIHAWIDWKISRGRCIVESIWPRVKKAIEFAWVPGGWDANRDGVMEGVQHNTYDVEFYGPNPMCGIYYLGALRAGGGDGARCGRLESGRDLPQAV